MSLFLKWSPWIPPFSKPSPPGPPPLPLPKPPLPPPKIPLSPPACYKVALHWSDGVEVKAGVLRVYGMLIWDAFYDKLLHYTFLLKLANDWDDISTFWCFWILRANSFDLGCLNWVRLDFLSMIPLNETLWLAIALVYWLTLRIFWEVGKIYLDCLRLYVCLFKLTLVRDILILF